MILEDSPLSVETPTIPAHGTETQAMGTAALRVQGRRRYVKKVVQDVIKPAIKSFLETCDTDPRIAALLATPALLGFFLVLTFFIFSTLVLVVWSIFSITSSIIFVIIAGIIFFFFKLLVLVLATFLLAAIVTGLVVGANKMSQSIISRIRQNPVVTQTGREIDWKSVIEHLINVGKNLGPGSAAVLERLVILSAALHNFFVTFKSGVEDLNTSARNLRDPPTHSTAETGGKLGQGNSNSELGETSAIKRRAPFSRTSEDDADGVLILSPN